MPAGLKYADALKLLGGQTPVGKVIDNLLGGALSVATAGGSAAALSLFDAKAEVVRLGHIATDKIQDRVRGLGRYDRSERLQAAHSVLVVLAFFEGFDAVVVATDLESPELTRADQIMLAAGAPAESGWLDLLVHGGIPVPSPDSSYLDSLTTWYEGLARQFTRYLAGLAVWERATDRDRRAVTDLVGRLPELAVDRYEAARLRLATDIPEFELWLRRTETRAIGRSLARLESTLLRATSGRAPQQHRSSLATAYRAELGRPILSGASAEVAMPTLGEAYVDPMFRIKAAGRDARPADETWWDSPSRSDLAAMLAEYLTTPQAVRAPLLLLGQPGAGKSALTRVLAARLPAADFLVVRVVLREVPAEAEIQDQIEQGLRATIGETVAWAELARSAEGALPVILLDGFDELLQATGVHQSDYLQRVAHFQEREAVQGRPVAVMVTSRIAVADRARLPAGSLAVRLDDFDEPQVARWLETWNAANVSDLPLDAVWQFPDLAGQPLLLLMLALYDATGNSLQESLDPAELYERLLTEFADREVRRLHAGRPEAELPGLVQAELARLSIVAFAMFNRSRQWVTEAELDADLAGLGIEASRPARNEDFRSALTPGQELVGRFFFIQRAHAVQDGRKLQTYEFLHATFGEYLVARLIVQALRSATAAAVAARAMPLHGQKPDDGMVKSLLGLTPLTTRGTVLSFVGRLLTAADRPAIRSWLIEVLRAAVIRPEPPPSAYRPMDRRIDHWMAMYSLNLVLLVLACGEPLRASELFVHAKDPAAWLRNSAQQWRAAVPSGMWIDVMKTLQLHRTWAGDRRDMELLTGPPAVVEEVDLLWAHGVAPGRPFDVATAGEFDLPPALTSMHLSSNLSEDLMRHALQPLLSGFPSSWLTSLELHGPQDAESLAHSLLQLWLLSARYGDVERLAVAYDRAVRVLKKHSVRPALAMVLEMLVRDATRLPATKVLGWVADLARFADFIPEVQVLVLECLAVIDTPGKRELATARAATALMPHKVVPDAPWSLRLFLVLGELGEHEAQKRIFDDGFLDLPEVRAALAADRLLRLRLADLPRHPLTDQAG